MVQWKMTWVFKSTLSRRSPDQMEKETDKALVPWRANQSDKSSAPWCISGQFVHFLKLTFARGMWGRMYGVWQPHLSFTYGLNLPACVRKCTFLPKFMTCACICYLLRDGVRTCQDDAFAEFGFKSLGNGESAYACQWERVAVFLWKAVRARCCPLACDRPASIYSHSS